MADLLKFSVTWSGHMVYGQSYADHVTGNLNKSAMAYKKLPLPNLGHGNFIVGCGRYLYALL